MVVLEVVVVLEVEFMAGLCREWGCRNTKETWKRAPDGSRLRVSRFIIRAAGEAETCCGWQA